MSSPLAKGPSASDAPPPDLKRERDELLQSLTRGTRLTEEFLAAHERLLARLQEVEEENARLRATVQAEDAIRDLLQRIDGLETEKRELLSRTQRAEATSSAVTSRVHEVEEEFSNLANLFVATNQLHATLSPRQVVRRVKEVLAQFVGAERYGMYLVNADGTELVPVASEGLPGESVAPLPVDGPLVGDAFRQGAARVEDGDPSQGTPSRPVAVIPLMVDDRGVGVIVVYSTLAQKTSFDTIDFQLFKLLGQHAAAALVCASLFVQAGRKLPGLEAFLDLSV